MSGGGGESTQPTSPCINVCRIDEQRGICEGCHRTLDEIARWARYSDAEKRAVLARLPARRNAAPGTGAN